MTDLRLAATRALEALENVTHHFTRTPSTLKDSKVRGDAHKSITTLRAALAQPDVPDVDVVKHATNRFLVWRLPEHFSPDSFISFDREKHNTWGGYPNSWPTGTNLFTYEQAKEMFAYCLDGFPKVPEGYVLVPVEPTPEMWKAVSQFAHAGSVWDAMLAAAPKGGA